MANKKQKTRKVKKSSNKNRGQKTRVKNLVKADKQNALIRFKLKPNDNFSQKMFANSRRSLALNSIMLAIKGKKKKAEFPIRVASSLIGKLNGLLKENKLKYTVSPVEKIKSIGTKSGQERKDFVKTVTIEKL